MIIGVDALADLRAEAPDTAITLVHGVFDVLHPGHIRHLEVAKQVGEIVVVVLWGDVCTHVRKGPNRPVNGIDYRLAMIDNFKQVDYCFEVPGEKGWPNDLMQPVVASLEPDYYLVSSRQHPIFGGAAVIDHPDGRQTSLLYDLTYGQKCYSSTAIIEALTRSEAT